MSDIDKYIESLTGTEIAIIGLSFKFPGADNVKDFWERLSSSAEMIRHFSDEELVDLGVRKEDIDNPSYVKTAIEQFPNKGYFDNHFFGYTPEEAQVMDPQTRVFHELAWEALESSGYIRSRGKHKIGVFAGSSSSYNHELLNTLYGRTQKIGHFNAHRLASKDYLCSRVAYSLNLTGPVYAVNTTCSTSLVAIHLASRAILTGECKMALAGGISIFPDKARGYLHNEGGVLSKDGHCRAFDASSSGTNFGEGGGIVVLKRLKEAVQDGDIIHAVIKGSAVNNDGKRKVGYTAPSVDGQKEVIRMAHKMARIQPDSLSFIEAHGTGTYLGDPIEIEALRLAFGKMSPDQKCAIGSVKTNLGHLDCAAGVAGVIKSVLSLQNHKILPSVNFENPNPKIPFEQSPLYVNNELKEWQPRDKPMRGAVSSFGIGGTNVHMVLEEAPVFDRSKKGLGSEQLITLSAKSDKALEQMKEEYAHFMEASEAELCDISNTLHKGREQFSNRLFFIAQSKEEAIEILRGQPEKIQYGKANESKKKFVFVFPGQGSQYHGIAKELYDKDVYFRKEIDQCFSLIPSTISDNLKAVIGNTDKKTSVISTDITQVLLFIVQYALVQSLKRIGVTPDVMIGHSLGEYVAACVSGVFSLEDGLKVIVKRGELMQKASEGAMIHVKLPESQLRLFVSGSIALAAVNSEDSGVLSGSPDEIESVMQQLAKKGVDYTKLNTNRAFHSTMMKSVVDDFRVTLNQVQLTAPVVPFISNLSGNYISQTEAKDPEYWIKHLLGTVRFADGIKTLSDLENKIILEIGTKRSLSSYVHKILGKENEMSTISLLRHPKENLSDVKTYLNAIGNIWLAGNNIDWVALDEFDPGQTTILPSYPFERKYFGNPKDFFDIINEKSLFNMLGASNQEITYTPVWKKVHTDHSIASGEKVIFISNGDFADLLHPYILKYTDQLLHVKISDDLEIRDNEFSANLSNKEQCASLFEAIAKIGFKPDVIIYSVVYERINDDLNETEYIRVFNNVISSINICKAISANFAELEIELKFINNNSCEIIGQDLLSPYQSAHNGMVGVVNSEYPYISCSSVDIDIEEQKFNFELLAKMLLSSDSEPGVKGLRRGNEWIRNLEPLDISELVNETPVGNAKTILITGGLGGLGLAFANAFAANDVNLVLISRTQLPEKEYWEEWVDNKPELDPIVQKINQIHRLENRGSKVLYFDADLADDKAIEVIYHSVVEELGSVDGVIHAAGIAGRKIIERVDAAELEKQWSAKVRGLAVLNGLLSEADLEFFVNFSTINSVKPGLAQVGYATANSVLDAFIYTNRIKSCSSIKTINWDSWREVGMAHESQKAKHSYLSNIEIYESSSLIDYVGYDIEDKAVFVSHFEPDHCWFLNEHRVIDGKPVFPGTGYIELINMTVRHLAKSHKISVFENLYFLAPMVFNDNKPKVVKTIISKKDGCYDVKVGSHSYTDFNNFTIHVQTTISIEEKNDIEHMELQSYLDHYERDRTNIDYNKLQSAELGPRWNNLTWLTVKEDQGLACLKLPDTFLIDLETHHLHPALLDIATGFLYMAVKKDKSYLPFCYEKIIIRSSLSSGLYSHVLWRKNKNSDNLVFDVSIWDNSGNVVVQVEGLTYMPVTIAIQESQSAFTQSNSSTVPSKPVIEVIGHGLSVEENMSLFDRFMRSNCPQLCIQSMQNASFDFLTAESIDEEETEKRERENIVTPYVKPVTNTEVRMAKEWQNFFGIKEIGITDNFFELGGDSVKVSIIISRLNKLFESNISLTQFFSSPTIKEISQQIDSNGKSRLLEINISEKREYYEMSAAQKRIHVLELINPESTLYNITEGFVVEGDFDQAKLEAAYKNLLIRHESLRTSIVKVGNYYYQRVHDEIDAQIEYFKGDESSIKDNLHRFRRPFDMNSAPLIRVGVFEIAEGKNYVVIDLLHLIADGTSLLLIINEFLSLYQGAELPPVAKQYKDFAEWQSRLLKTSKIEKQKEFWRGQLSGALQRVQLPYDYDRTSEEELTQAAGNFEFTLTQELTTGVKQLAKEHDVTNFMAFMSLLNVFFNKLSGQEDVLIGIPHIGRVDEFSNVIGMFINTVMLRNYPKKEKTYLGLLQEVKLNTLGAFDNLDFQYEFILDMLRNEVKTDTDNLLTVFFNYRNMFVESSESVAADNKVKVSSAGMEDNFAKFDLSIYAYDFNDVFSFTCNYAKNLFSEETIGYLMEQFKLLIAEVVANPDKCIEQYKILDDSALEPMHEAEDIFDF